jgi:hypothetical protein
MADSRVDGKPFAHWVAIAASILFVAAGQLGAWYASKASYPVCTGSTPAVAGGNWLAIAVLVLAPVSVAAALVSLIRGPRAPVRVIVSLTALATVAALFWHYWLEMVDWGMGCGY